ncbi:MAG: UrcA family protein [Halieaceae bacterium]|jgi:UrcA family protein|nr:UrcA family protein [Halieaceae bacterium]
MKTRTTRNTLATAIVFAVAGSTASLGHASLGTHGTESLRINTAKINLETPESADALYRQLQRAANEVCSQTYSRIPDRSCVEETMDRTVEKIDNARLTARHQEG